MLAVIKTGGKQYIIKEGDIFDIEKIEGEKGSKKNIKEVLLVADDKNVKLGNPFIEGTEAEIEIIDQYKGKKVEILKFKRKTGYRRKKGHRQNLTKIEIKKIKWQKRTF